MAWNRPCWSLSSTLWRRTGRFTLRCSTLAFSKCGIEPSRTVLRLSTCAMTDGLRVAIDAQIAPGRAGGVAPFVRSLIRALGQLADGCESYTIIVNSEQQWDWLSSHLGPNQTLTMIS